MATILCSPTFDCARDCKEIHDTWMQSNHLARLLTHRTRKERREIREKYLEMYDKDLADCLQRAREANPKNEIYKAWYIWMLDPHERDAVIAREAIEYIDTELKSLVEIYACRKSSQLFLIKQAYQARFKRNLDQDIMSEPSHPYQRILVALAASHRSHHADISRHTAQCDAKRLYEATKGRTGAIDESVILEMLSKRSIPQFRHTLSSYKHIYGHSYTKSLEKGLYEEFEGALKVVIKCMYDPPRYYSKILYMSIKGMTTDNSALARVMVGRAEVDMEEIKSVFQKKNGRTLQDALCGSIEDEAYRDFLVALTAI